jgi:hypothetical protein
VRKRFAEFYAALFDKTIEANPGAVVTEYAWSAKQDYHCDPCPELDVTASDILALGGNVLKTDISKEFVMTRLHARYSSKEMKDDLRFRAAAPVVGGREQYSRAGERKSVPSALRDPSLVDRADQMREAAAWCVGRSARRQRPRCARGESTRVRTTRQARAR